MTIEAQFIGKKFVLIARALRVLNLEGGKRTVRYPARPFVKDANGNPRYIDSKDEPTLVTFQKGDYVDVQMLLNSGAIIGYRKPKAATKRKAK